ncbi:MAG: two pore domain potassium channel family protein [Tissierellales bacterium]|nr:two pore domain potassium channel family protein [Tissierellales bacterium]
MLKQSRKKLFSLNDILQANIFILIIALNLCGMNVLGYITVILLEIGIIGLFIIGTKAIMMRLFGGKYSRAISWFGIQVFFILLAFSEVYTKLGIIDNDGVIVKNRLTSWYFSVVTFTTLGYGDFKPTPLARLFAATEAILGYFSLGILLFLLFRVLNVEQKRE